MLATTSRGAIGGRERECHRIAIGVVELHQATDIAHLQELFVNEGVWIRPFGKMIYLMPPYIVTPDDLSRLSRAIGVALDTC